MLALPLATAIKTTSRILQLVRRIPALLPLSTAAALMVVPIVTPPIPWLPELGDNGSILGTLMTAQAAIAALTLAVTLFIMQGLNTRRDVDDRIYSEYVRQSKVRDILWGSLLAVGVTGVLLLSERFIIANGAAPDSRPELRNLILAAGLAFIFNLALAGALFEQAVRLSRPEHWRAMRQAVNKRDVRNAVQAFLGRFQRALASKDVDESDLTILFPDSDEGSADEAVVALLDDARRAMTERRHGEFASSLSSIRELITYSMEEFKGSDIEWSSPGANPEWPPLRELTRNLYSFREQVIGDGDRDYVFELLHFDYWLTTTGVRERCGELFTVGLAGYRWNYQIAIGLGGQFHELLRDRFAHLASNFVLEVSPTEAFPYATELLKLQERLLYEAMRANLPEDYAQLHARFEVSLQAISLRWRSENSLQSESTGLFERLDQEYRIMLMGLGGRAISLFRSNKITDANPYLAIARGVFDRVELMAGDLPKALERGRGPGFSPWHDWDIEDGEPNRTISMSPEKYPLAFFSLRLIELSSESMPDFDLQGRAKQAFEWFNRNLQWVARLIHFELDPTLEQRQAFSIEALRSAVRRDEISEDYEIIGRILSVDRVLAFTSDVYAAAFTPNSVERLFEEAGAFLYLASGAESAPRERGARELLPKGSLTDTPEGALMGYGKPDATGWGRALSDDVLSQFCEALEGSPNVEAAIDAPVALLLAIDQAIEELNPEGRVALVLAGNWFRLVVGLNMENLEGYEPSSRLSESERLGETGRYRGHPILIAPDHEGRRLYVVDIAGWGCFVRAQSEDAQDLRIKIKPVSVDRARQLLEGNPNHFASQPDEESKLRKLQTCVEIVVGARTGFRVSDPSRARVVVPADQEQEVASDSVLGTDSPQS